ncbi:hypothetical protein OOJ91_29905 [Micromonospora lupini]|uniref:hypothetical protein n=1 Tax=Micromonospora lupini TaxID=285679 RepID=UPI00224D7FEC|nr:hypothetical protein [Micromonospora lupini]MCX5070068.1 hypothetical protein [Micromonospora lupini]
MIDRDSTLLVCVSLNVVDTRLDDAVRRCQPLVAALGAVGLTAARADPDGGRRGVNVDLTLQPPPLSAAGEKAVRQLAAPLLSRFGWGHGDVEVDESARGHPTLFAAGRERTRDGMTPLCVSVLTVADSADDALDLRGGDLAGTASVERLPLVAAEDDVVVRVLARLEAPNLDRALARCLPLLGRTDVWSVGRPAVGGRDGRGLGTVQALYVRTGADPFDRYPVETS